MNQLATCDPTTDGPAFEYDDVGRLARVVDRAGDETCYRYGANDLLREVDCRGVVTRYEHDIHGRLTRVHRGNAGAVVYRYDPQGQIVEGRTSTISTRYAYDEAGRTTSVRQDRDGVSLELRLAYDDRGRLSRLALPGASIVYEWDARNRLTALRLGDREILAVAYQASCHELRFPGAVSEVIGRSHRCLTRGGEVVARYEYRYDEAGRLTTDGVRSYEYDHLGRLAVATEGVARWEYDHASEPAPAIPGRLDDAGQLVEVRRTGATVATYEYDHKGRLARATSDGTSERFLYGLGDELFAVTDDAGRPLRVYLRTPLGCVGEVRGERVFFHHNDERGSCRTVTDLAGAVVRTPAYDPFGRPEPSDDGPGVVFAGHVWNDVARLYNAGARWYDPATRRFLTADTYTGGPDDARIVNPLTPASQQRYLRTLWLESWREDAIRRDPFAYCGNDPVNRVDPSGHWSAGYVILSLLGAIWSLPNTALGLALEATVLVGEVLRWVIFVFSLGHASWATPGISGAASGRLNTFALVFRGGWIGSFSGLLGLTFGNIFFVNDTFEQHPVLQGDDVSPAAYGGRVTLNRRDAFYEHMLRHTNHASWFGPIFHLGMPLWGFYWWDRIAGGGPSSWLERDARNHGGV